MPSSPPQDEPPASATLAGSRIVLCVTGGIAAYKAAYLTRALVRAGARVIVMMTKSACRFVAPLTFETLSGNRVVTSTFERAFEMGAVEHIDLAEWADVVVVAPATYNFLGKIHAGVADDVVTTFMTAVTCPVVVAPAMNEHMWRNPVNQRNLAGLRPLGWTLLEPGRGGLACSWVGEGRMREPEEILEAVEAAVRAQRRDASRKAGATSRTPPSPRGTAEAAAPRGSGLAGVRILVTAGGTQEAIDPVRFIGNRSSGRMGFALAEEAARRGARVHVVRGPGALPDPAGVETVHPVQTADEMAAAVQAAIDDADVLLMAAAVSDWRPVRPASGKIKRGSGKMSLDLEPTPDILANLKARKGGRLFVGFALETADPEAEARRKLAAKGLDLVVANRVGPESGPDVDTNQVWIYDAEGLVAATPVAPKPQIAAAILDVVESAWARAGKRDAGNVAAAATKEDADAQSRT